jgi:hypothetical protein
VISVEKMGRQKDKIAVRKAARGRASTPKVSRKLGALLIFREAPLQCGVPWNRFSCAPRLETADEEKSRQAD